MSLNAYTIKHTDAKGLYIDTFNVLAKTEARAKDIFWDTYPRGRFIITIKEKVTMR